MCLIFCIILKENYLLRIILLTDQISLLDCLYFLRFGQYVYCCPVCDVINFEVNLSFLIKPFICINEKSGQKCKYLKNKIVLKKARVVSIKLGFTD